MVKKKKKKKNPPANEGDVSLIPGSGRFPGDGNGNPFQYSELHGVWHATVYGWGHRESETTEQLNMYTIGNW